MRQLATRTLSPVTTCSRETPAWHCVARLIDLIKNITVQLVRGSMTPCQTSAGRASRDGAPRVRRYSGALVARRRLGRASYVHEAPVFRDTSQLVLVGFRLARLVYLARQSRRSVVRRERAL